VAEIIDQVSAPVALLADRPLLEAAASHPALERARLAVSEEEIDAALAPPERFLAIRSLGSR
jgi:hypothetical protein